MEKTIKDECLLCSKKFQWKDVVIGKMPENVWFCQNCAEKFEDKKTYKGIEAWVVLEYEPDIKLEYLIKE